ncbi:MAG TPA: uracil phosphoribosyltransferase, partial [Gemmatimonadales bacterium]|nr:uracil phosphoribosyltransferase [Gemmatimonadales bacterium]
MIRRDTAIELEAGRLPILPIPPALPHIPPMLRTSFSNLTVLDHPLIQHKVTLLRDKGTSTRDFKQLVNEIAMLMAFEVTKDLPTEPVSIETPLERMEGRQVAGK